MDSRYDENASLGKWVKDASTPERALLMRDAFDAMGELTEQEREIVVARLAKRPL